MGQLLFNVNENGLGSFSIVENDELLAEMEIGIAGTDLTAYHTEVFPKGEGKGLAKKLLEAMADYARKNQLKVIALCPYVLAQFKRHADEYADIWHK